ncbi:MAG TPA: hypothetical protein ENK10_00200, partial [Acidobacteria bacterium]|nr:hypothetical protein [Acidobacteriota bacterium]
MVLLRLGGPGLRRVRVLLAAAQGLRRGGCARPPCLPPRARRPGEVNPVRVADFDYHLPAEQIAQQAATPRHAARMLVFERGDGFRPRHRRVADLPQELSPGDLLVVNNTRVVPARLLAHKPTGGRVEVFLLEALDADRRRWRALLGASRQPAEGSRVRVAEGFEVEILTRLEGAVEVRLLGDAAPDDL